MEVIMSVIILAVTAMIVASAPTLTEGQVPVNSVITDQGKQKEYYRDKRSHYQYMSPCAAAAASSPVPAIVPSAYQVNLSPYHQHAAPQNYYAVHPYRSAEFEPEEFLSFSDMEHMMSEHMPMARYAYPSPPASHLPINYAAPLVPPVTTAPAFGMFPNANAGGCSMPLLFSCSPSIVPGHVVPAQAHQTYGNAYRGVDPLSHHGSQEEQEEPTVHENLNPVHDQSHTKVHQ